MGTRRQNSCDKDRIVGIRIAFSIAIVSLLTACAGQPDVLEARDAYATNGEVRIHYREMGSGPLIVFIHGFPDIWYTWRRQMSALSKEYRTVAMDLRGYNLSDAPEGVDNYYYDDLEGDVLAVIHDLGEEQAIIVGHDWGAAIAWRLATQHPEAVRRLVVCSVPHPQGLSRAIHKKDGALDYANRFIEAGAEKNFPPEWLSGWVKDPAVREVYLEAFRRSDIRAMLNYYRANFRSGPDMPEQVRLRNAIQWTPVRSPVLIIFGEADPYLPVDGLNYSWEYVDRDLRIEVIQDAGHFVQYDAPDKVTRSIRSWLADQQSE